MWDAEIPFSGALSVRYSSMMPTPAVSCVLLSLASAVQAFSVVGAHGLAVKPRNPQCVMTLDQQNASSPVDEIMSKYVLLRPKDFDNEDRSGWNARTPGTARTILFSSLFCLLVALPYILTQPAVLVKLVELAALDRVGETPLDVFEKTGKLIP